MIAEGAVGPRYASILGPIIKFQNTVAYTSYRLTFPERVDHNGRVSVVQAATFSEMKLLGTHVKLGTHANKGDGLRIVDGVLDSFNIPVDSFDLGANNETKYANRLHFKMRRLNTTSFTAMFARFNSTDQVFSMQGTIGFTGPVDEDDSRVGPITFSSLASFGSTGTAGLVLNGKDPTKSQLSFAMGDTIYAGTAFRGDSLAVRYDAAAKSFKYSGKASWLYRKQVVPAVPLQGSTQSALDGFVLQGRVNFEGIDVHTQGFSLEFVGFDALNGGRAVNNASTINVQGKAVPVEFSFRANEFFAFDKNNNGLILFFGPALSTPLAFSVGGISLEKKDGKVLLPGTPNNKTNTAVFSRESQLQSGRYYSASHGDASDESSIRQTFHRR